MTSSGPDETPIMTVLIADDHPILRRAVRELLEKEGGFKVIAEACDGEEAINLANKLAPNMIIMDVGMPKTNGLEATRRIKASHPEIAILVLTVHDEEEYVLGMLKAGVAGYIMKSELDEQILQAARAVASGEIVLSTSVTKQLLRLLMKYPVQQITQNKSETLTSRESEILRFVARGMSNKDISNHLGISVHTVKSSLMRIFSKLGVASRTEAVMKGLLTGHITFDDVY